MDGEVKLDGGGQSQGNGTPVRWKIEGTALTISGSGPMTDYRGSSEVPWRGCAAAVTALVVEDGVTTLGDYAFYACENLSAVSLPGSLERIGTYAFGGCRALTSIVVPEGVRIIAAKAFSDASSLTSIQLPATLEAIDMKAFHYDTRLASVTYAGTARQWGRIRLSSSGRGNANLLNARITCAGAAVTAAGTFSDITGGVWYEKALDELAEGGYLTGGAFRPDAPAGLELALSILYRRAGSPGAYGGASRWGERSGLTAGIPAGSLTAGDLYLVLARTAVHNGRLSLSGETVEEQRSAALAWAEENNLTAAGEAGRVLTRAEAAVILEGYLQSGLSTADRHGQIIAAVRRALRSKGDGRMYILAPDLSESAKAAKTGDCTLIVFPDGQTMMIDSGVSGSEEKVMNMVRELELARLDYFVLTHPHADHAGNALAVANYLYDNGGAVGAYYYSGYPAPEGRKTEADIADFMAARGVAADRAVHAGRRWNIGGVTVEALGPLEAEVNSGNTADEFVNNVSILLKMTYGSSTYLTGGDLYISQELLLIGRLGRRLRADIMKANHHGLYTSNSREWLRAVSPLVMVAENDDVGSSALAGAASGMGIAYYSAGVDGDVLITMDSARNYHITTQYDSDLRKGYTGPPGGECRTLIHEA